MSVCGRFIPASGNSAPSSCPLYCEQLGLEMGMYDTAYDRFGMLGYQIWRAARLVVDNRYARAGVDA